MCPETDRHSSEHGLPNAFPSLAYRVPKPTFICTVCATCCLALSSVPLSYGRLPIGRAFGCIAPQNRCDGFGPKLTTGGSTLPALWLEEARLSLGRWKARLRRAQHCALRQERRQAALLQHQSLHLRQLQSLGATVPTSLLTEAGSPGCCALCNRCFKDYGAWAVHAFATHGRTDEARRLALGSHVFGISRPQISSAGTSGIAVHAGVTSYRQAAAMPRSPALAAGRVLTMDWPCCQFLASGPRPRPADILVEAAEDRPAAEVLDCLAHLNYDGTLPVLSETDLWSRIRTAFSCVCLQSSRLRVTACCWRDLIERGTGEADPVAGCARQTLCLGWFLALTRTGPPQIPSSTVECISPFWHVTRSLFQLCARSTRMLSMSRKVASQRLSRFTCTATYPHAAS